MMRAMSTAHAKKTGNPVLDHAGISALIFGALVFVGFLYALYGAATSHHGGEHAGAGEHPAPAASAPAAGH
jgi:hypothetical protein